MARIKRPGLKSPGGLRSGDSTRSSLSRDRSTRSTMSKSGHGMGRSTRSTRSGMSAGELSREDDGEDSNTNGTNPLQRTGQSMRNFLKTASSVSSGMGLSTGTGGGSTHSGGGKQKQPPVKLSYKQKKARPGLAVAPQGFSSRRGMSTRGISTRSAGSKANLSSHGSRRQMSTRNLSGHSGHSSGGGTVGTATGRQKSSRTVQSSNSNSSGSKLAPTPPSDAEGVDDEDDEEYDEFAEDDEEEILELPHTEEEIRKGLHTESVKKGFFRKKVRSIKWYSADIDKIDAGNFEEQNDSEDEYETDSDDDSETPPTPDPWYRILGRGLLLMERKGQDSPTKRWIKCFTVFTFLCNLSSGLVAVAQYEGVEKCCGTFIHNMGRVHLNWPVIVQVCIYGYLFLILLEIYPVMRRGFPFNIFNSIFGYCITFALFFDDSVQEAWIMWSLETLSVLSEFCQYKIKIRQVNKRAIEIKKLRPKTTKKKETFEDEDDYLKDLHKARRRYYVIKQEQRNDQKLLRFMHIAVYLNLTVSSIMAMFILVISSNGGVCYSGYEYPNVFARDQLKRCNLIADPAYGCDLEEHCQVCLPETEQYQCYYVYY